MKIPINDLESKVRSTLMFGGSSPVSFSGEGRMKLQYHEFMQCPDYARADRSWTESNWEGNEDMLRIGMVVRASRNTVLWLENRVQNTLRAYLDANATPVTTIPRNNYGMIQDQTRHDKLEERPPSTKICARGSPFEPSLPLLAENGKHPVDRGFSPYNMESATPQYRMGLSALEIEQPINRYYDYNIAKGAKEAVLRGIEKALNGIDLESINLPWDLYLNAIYGIYERYDSDDANSWIGRMISPTPETGRQTQAKQRGVGNTYNQVSIYDWRKTNCSTG